MTGMYGEMIRKLLREKGISQTALARKVGLPQGVISRYLGDRVNIPAVRLAAIAAALHVSMYEITGGKPPDIPVTLEKLKTVNTDQLIAELKARGFPEKAIEFVRSPEGKDLEPWQIDAIQAILRGGGKKEA